MCAKYKVPIVITSLGARTDVNDAVHAWGGVVLHDIINNTFAHKAIEKGADGLIAVAAGAGGHAGVKSPFALVQEIREWFDGPLALSGAIATGDAVLAAQAMGADFAYIGSAFIATDEARAAEAYKQCIVDSNSDDIVYSNLFTGVHGNYLKPSIRAAGLDPDNLPESDPSKMNFGGDGAKKAWKDIWGCGQGIGAVKAVVPAAELVARLRASTRRRGSALLRGLSDGRIAPASGRSRSRAGGDPAPRQPSAPRSTGSGGSRLRVHAGRRSGSAAVLVPTAAPAGPRVRRRDSRVGPAGRARLGSTRRSRCRRPCAARRGAAGVSSDADAHRMRTSSDADQFCQQIRRLVPSNSPRGTERRC